MNVKEYEPIIKQPPNLRYEYFIKKVVVEIDVLLSDINNELENY